jgi:hypothetical protein
MATPSEENDVKEQSITDVSNMGKNWTGENIAILLQWVINASYVIKCLDDSIEECRKMIRNNVILGLILSTASGTISVTNFSKTPNANFQLCLNLLFTTMSFVIAINTGRIKVYQVQERLEKFITDKHDWTTFITAIAAELQSPYSLRADANTIIINNKKIYLNLLRRDNEFTKGAKEKIKDFMENDRKVWFEKNKDLYNIHTSLLNMNSKIELYSFLDTMLWKEGLNLIEAESMDNYNPRDDITAFLNVKSNKFTKDNIIKKTCDIEILSNKCIPPMDKKKSCKIIDLSLLTSKKEEQEEERKEEEEEERKEEDEVPGLIDIETGTAL